MSLKLKMLIYSILLNCLISYSQAEKPQVYVNYIKINETSKKIRESKISKCVELLFFVGRSAQDTVNIWNYDKTGNLTHEFSLVADTVNKDNSYYQNYSYSYDKDGRLAERIDSTGSLVKKNVLSYDDFGNIIKEEAYISKNKIGMAISYEYDMLLRLVESTEQYFADDRKIKTQYAYDSYNNVTKLSGMSSGGSGRKVDITYSYKYDSKYNIIEKQTINFNGNNKTQTYKYDGKGNLVHKYESLNKDSYSEFIYYYDNAGNNIKIEKTETSGDKTSAYTEYLTYDSHGNLTEDQYTGPNGETIANFKYYYEYYN